MTNLSRLAIRPAGPGPTGAVLAPTAGELASVLVELAALLPRVDAPHVERLKRAITHLQQVLAACGHDATQAVGTNR